MGSTQSTWGIQKRKALIKQPKRKPKKKDGTEHLLSIQHEEPLQRCPLQEELDGWMIPSRSQNTFKEFKSMFNQDETKVEEDETKMEVKISASEYKPEELKVSVQSGQLLVEGKHEEKKEDGSAYVMRSFSRSYTLPKEARTRWCPSSLPR